MSKTWSIVVPVWGRYHTDLLLSYGLPSHIANVGDLTARGDRVRYLIYAEDRARVEKAMRSEGLHHLAALHFLPLPAGDERYRRMAACHTDAWFRSPGHRLTFLLPDAVISAGYLAAVARRMDDGAKIVTAPCLRTVLRPETSGQNARPARALAAHALVHMHPIQARQLWGAVPSTTPSVLLFSVPHGIIVHAFHHHVLAMMQDGRPWLETRGTFDTAMAGAYRPGECYVVQDSDELALIDIAPADKDAETVDTALTIDGVAAWVRATASNCWPIHMHHFRTPCLIRTGPGPVEAHPISNAVLLSLAQQIGQDRRPT